MSALASEIPNTSTPINITMTNQELKEKIEKLELENAALNETVQEQQQIIDSFEANIQKMSKENEVLAAKNEGFVILNHAASGKKFRIERNVRTLNLKNELVTAEQIAADDTLIDRLVRIGWQYLYEVKEVANGTN